MSRQLLPSELLLNPDGSVYHLNLLPEDIADTIIFVGDPNRVDMVSKYFDSIDVKKVNREFVTCTGYVGKKRLTVMSTGMGGDNIDIVMNELDALVNVDLKQRKINRDLKQLTIVRLGTCGALQHEVPIDSYIITNLAFGMDGLLAFYEHQETDLEEDAAKLFRSKMDKHFDKIVVFAAEGDAHLVDSFRSMGEVGMTISCPGFYAPQARQIRAPIAFPDFIERASGVEIENKKILNFEMETVSIYGLSKVLNHRSCSISTVINNRVNGTFSSSFRKSVDNMIKVAIEKLEALD